MPVLDANSIDAIVTDPPYGLVFMGKDWDKGVPGVAFWTEALRVAKPGAHMLAFGGTRTWHRLACAIEDAGWEIRDTVMWVYGSGFPKSHSVDKAIDKAAGAEREVVGRNPNRDGRKPEGYHEGWARPWQANSASSAHLCTAPATPAAKQWAGWGTALKPAWEPIILARKPLQGTVAANVLAWGTGAINVDGCRIGTADGHGGGRKGSSGFCGDNYEHDGFVASSVGRWPANFIHDGSDEVLALMPNVKAGVAVRHNSGGNTFGGDNPKPPMADMSYSDSGSAARFFYCAKASKADRDEGLDGMELRKVGNFDDDNYEWDITKTHRPAQPRRNHHPTVKPTALMRYLCRLVTPPGGVVLDPFMGSGSTGKAAVMEGFDFMGIEVEPEYYALAEARIAHAQEQHTPQLEFAL
jgi:site-specific DNA-methyltransferase (adenine-specific)